MDRRSRHMGILLGHLYPDIRIDSGTGGAIFVLLFRLSGNKAIAFIGK